MCSNCNNNAFVVCLFEVPSLYSCRMDVVFVLYVSCIRLVCWLAVVLYQHCTSLVLVLSSCCIRLMVVFELFCVGVVFVLSKYCIPIAMVLYP